MGVDKKLQVSSSEMSVLMVEYRFDSKAQLRPDMTSGSGWSVYRPASGASTYQIERRSVVDLLLYCESGRTMDEIKPYVHEEMDISSDEVAALVSELLSESVLVRGERSTEEARWFRYHWTQAFYYHLASRDLTSESALSDRRSSVTIPTTRQRRPDSELMALPVLNDLSPSSLVDILSPTDVQKF